MQVDLKPLRETSIAVPPQPPKIPEKRKAEDADASKDLKKVSRYRSASLGELAIFFLERAFATRPAGCRSPSAAINANVRFGAGGIFTIFAGIA